MDGMFLGMLEEAGYMGKSKETLRKLALNIAERAHMMQDGGHFVLDKSTFSKACYSCGLDPDSFTQEELNELEDILNEIG